MPASTAHEVLSTFWNWTLPVDPFEIARAAGLRVETSAQLAPYSGEYFLAEDGTPILRVNASESRVRQRFTAAHELGHHFLGHGPRFRDQPANFNAGVTDMREVEANRFAADLLMPGDAVRLVIERWGKQRVEELAQTFDVSQVAMMIRLKRLGWLR